MAAVGCGGVKMVVCDKCGKEMDRRDVEHQFDDTYFFCEGCAQKLVDWINEDHSDAAQAAMNKEVPKKPELTESRRFGICPNCERLLSRREQPHGLIDIPRCKWCGQAIDWSE